MSATVDATSGLGAVLSGPAGSANALVQLQTESSLSKGGGAVRQALHGVSVHLRTIQAFPTFLAETGSIDAEAVIRASRMRTVHNVAKFAFETTTAEAFTPRTFTMTRAIRNFTFVVFQAALTTFPARIALALTVDVVATAAAQYWAHT